ncbi:MAG: hypothetical protein IPL13_08990 [Saprospiraceae bacterium]|jgi:hypothetical protein|uniref:hypothetical protein n=1 Tax=Candidatus Brachybacter algidus TaxID=2982024 RepID=UPI001B5D56ED|nr:hypothetical protein [Candidatus Brachybacter algidus]MBP7304948.1 hypothetical protein [Saprospiraceae bacterium]MBK6374434.1 hypothetical protein [Candidatus Brachybacter algidus]MBK6449769.1 hypothetical protein [Candidatus Brachybacter algidus]MBK8355488.1 hypothetical protein [Candidatus Brachybacter algidus]MBK8604213.1 hypothetical protein [Candidatus Brachybacter algidus]
MLSINYWGRKACIFICSLFFFLFMSCSIKAQNESGVILKAGIHSTVFRKDNCELIKNGSSGYTIGFDGLFYNGKILIQPGIHLMTFPKQYTPVKEAFHDVFSRPDTSFHYGFKMPVRLGANLIDLGVFRLKAAIGLYGFYSHDGIYLDSEGTQNVYYVSGGWTANVGVIIKFLTIELDYDRTFGKADDSGPLYMRSLSLTAGLLF